MHRRDSCGIEWPTRATEHGQAKNSRPCFHTANNNTATSKQHRDGTSAGSATPAAHQQQYTGASTLVAAPRRQQAGTAVEIKQVGWQVRDMAGPRASSTMDNHHQQSPGNRRVRTFIGRQRGTISCGQVSAKAPITQGLLQHHLCTMLKTIMTTMHCHGACTAWQGQAPRATPKYPNDKLRLVALHALRCKTGTVAPSRDRQALCNHRLQTAQVLKTNMLRHNERRNNKGARPVTNHWLGARPTASPCEAVLCSHDSLLRHHFPLRSATLAIGPQAITRA